MYGLPAAGWMPDDGADEAPADAAAAAGFGAMLRSTGSTPSLGLESGGATTVGSGEGLESDDGEAPWAGAGSRVAAGSGDATGLGSAAFAGTAMASASTTATRVA
jgi:hypothetical protein